MLIRNATIAYTAGGILGESLAKSIDRAMEREEGDFGEDNVEKHHIVAQGAALAEESRDILNRAGISVQSEQNKVVLSYGLHRVLHNVLYYEGVNESCEKQK